MKKCCILGHFAHDRNAANGQTIKTKILAEELRKQLGENAVCSIDTFGGPKVLLKAPFQVLSAFNSSQNVIMLPAHNGVRIYGRLLPLFRNFFKNKKIHYVVIGGWLPQFLCKRKRLAQSLKQFDGIYVETQTMKRQLEAQGLTNVLVMPNCKKLKTLTEEELVYPTKEPFPLCTFSRVSKEKGIADAVEAVQIANEQCGRPVYALDIYGSVDSGQEDWFEQLQKNFPPYIRYCGLVDYDKSIDVLKSYFCLMFPTHYEGEGFAGTIIDAYSAGIPVLASDWKYNAEIVNKDVGYIYETHNQCAFVNVLKNMANQPNEVLEKKARCLREAQTYNIERAVKILIDQM